MALFAFMFHFYVSTYWLSRLLKAETYDFYVSFLVSMFHSKKHWGKKTKTLWKRFKNTVGAIQKHWGSDNALPQRFEKWNMKLKMKHPSLMFHFSKWLIFNCFITKKWNMKGKTKVLKTHRNLHYYTSYYRFKILTTDVMTSRVNLFLTAYLTMLIFHQARAL